VGGVAIATPGPVGWSMVGGPAEGAGAGAGLGSSVVRRTGALVVDTGEGVDRVSGLLWAF